MVKLNFHKSGFTLVEMLIVVALIAILAAIAVPAYNNYVNRAKIKTAQADLVALGLNLENEYRKKLSYSGSSSSYANTAALKSKFDSWSPASGTGEFSFAGSVDTGSYSISATGTSGGVNGCVVTLTHDGNKTINSCSYSSGGTWL